MFPIKPSTYAEVVAFLNPHVQTLRAYGVTGFIVDDQLMDALNSVIDDRAAGIGASRSHEPGEQRVITWFGCTVSRKSS